MWGRAYYETALPFFLSTTMEGQMGQLCALACQFSCPQRDIVRHVEPMSSESNNAFAHNDRSARKPH